MKIKRLIQLLIAKFLSQPIIPRGKRKGYSLVSSEYFDVQMTEKSKIYPPFFIHHVQIGDFSYIAKNSTISNTTIGKFCSIGPNFCCGLGIHPTNGISTSPMFYSTGKQNGVTLCSVTKYEEYKRTNIGHDVFIGANVTVLDGVFIGDGAVIGAGAVVSKDIPPYAIAVGVPAKVVKYRFDKKTIEDMLQKQWWNWADDKLDEVEKKFWDVQNFIK